MALKTVFHLVLANCAIIVGIFLIFKKLYNFSDDCTISNNESQCTICNPNSNRIKVSNITGTFCICNDGYLDINN